MWLFLVSTDTIGSLINSTAAAFNTTTLTNTTTNTTDYPEVLAELVTNLVAHSFFDGYKLSSRALAQNLPLLNGLYVGILFSMVPHIVLLYFQMWKPFKANEEENKKDGEEKENENENEKKDEKEKEGDNEKEKGEGSIEVV